eukprot:1214338-Rhodomonas_salina.1
MQGRGARRAVAASRASRALVRPDAACTHTRPCLGPDCPNCLCTSQLDSAELMAIMIREFAGWAELGLERQVELSSALRRL